MNNLVHLHAAPCLLLSLLPLCSLSLSLSLNPLPWQQQSKNHLRQSPSIIDETHQAPTLTTKSTRPNHKLNPPITACPITNQTHRPQTQSLEKSTNHIKQNQQPNPSPLSSLTKIDPRRRRRSTSGDKQGGDWLIFFSSSGGEFQTCSEFFFFLLWWLLLGFIYTMICDWLLVVVGSGFKVVMVISYLFIIFYLVVERERTSKFSYSENIYFYNL